MAAIVELIIKDGKVSIEVSGVNDASCAEITRALEEALGMVESVQQKPEYFVALESPQVHVTD